MRSTPAMDYYQDQNDVPDYEEIAIHRRVSRKERKCHTCDRPILKGQRYDHRVYKMDGKFETMNSHGGCY